MKDKAKRDKEIIAALWKDLDEASRQYDKHRNISIKLMKLALDSGASESDIYEIIQDSNSLRKRM